MVLKDRIASLIIFGMACAGYFFSLEIPDKPARIPKTLLTILAIFAGILFISTFTRRKEPLEGGVGQEVNSSALLSKRLKVLSILVLTGLFIFGMPTLGFILSTPLAILGLMWLMGDRNKFRIAAVSIVGTLLIYYAFSYLLRVPLPKGFFQL